MSVISSAVKKVTGAVGLSGGGSGSPAPTSAPTPAPLPDTSAPSEAQATAAQADKLRSAAVGGQTTLLGGARDALGVGGGVTSRTKKTLLG